jgi:hypothetical protein
MNTCEIRHVKHKDSYRWKWRHVRANGTVQESKTSYSLYYECVLAARASGFVLELKCA